MVCLRPAAVFSTISQTYICQYNLHLPPVYINIPLLETEPAPMGGIPSPNDQSCFVALLPNSFHWSSRMAIKHQSSLRSCHSCMPSSPNRRSSIRKVIRNCATLKSSADLASTVVFFPCCCMTAFHGTLNWRVLTDSFSSI